MILKLLMNLRFGVFLIEIYFVFYFIVSSVGFDLGLGVCLWLVSWAWLVSGEFVGHVLSIVGCLWVDVLDRFFSARLCST